MTKVDSARYLQMYSYNIT